MRDVFNAAYLPAVVSGVVKGAEGSRGPAQDRGSRAVVVAAAGEPPSPVPVRCVEVAKNAEKIEI